MKVVIDTSSLLSLVRYYLPFDKQTILFEAIKSKIANGEILVIDKIIDECAYTSKGIVLTTLVFLTDKTFNKTNKLPLNTEFILPPAPAKFYRQVDNQFAVRVLTNKLSPSQYDVVKNEFMNSADMKLILTSLSLIKENPNEEIFLVTEETDVSNDKKYFQKIPAICSQLDIQTINIQQLFDKFDGITFEIK
ncbi:MAG TPA: DUF4411 domain-containing protein [Flavobacterium sp.]|nr:DUF4411 domain-containing protein [Flavobacterium sp.]HAT77662.1 DUF4411 domain-containing protein [Flavobacterium sp.]HAT81557.1 DUF4411 domain-containing protein [Flavobacterium sp.]